MPQEFYFPLLIALNPHYRRSHPSIFKGIALFTPGGDLVYCIDPGKQGRWHLNLCAVLEELLELPEPPHFLVPCYTATLDRIWDAKTQRVVTFAEAYPLVFRYRSLLESLFEVQPVNWQIAPLPQDVCDPIVIDQYRSCFPQLWDNHELVYRLETASRLEEASSVPMTSPYPQGYVLRLFVSGYSAATQRILQNLHELLEQSLGSPYTLKVIDIFKHPEQAEADHISATPTLVKVYPKPVRRIVGNLENADRVLQMLGALDERD
jgi:circadian clock protein KaiB